MIKDEIIVASAKGGPLPEGLNPAETFLFLSLRALYSHARHSDMSREQGAKEKASIISQYDKMELWVRVVEQHRKIESDFEGAWNQFAKNPTRDNADKLHQAWFRSRIKPVYQDEETKDIAEAE